MTGSRRRALRWACAACAAVLLVGGCSSSDDASPPPGADIPQAYRRAIPESEIQRFHGGQVGIVPGLAVAKLRLRSADASVSALTGTDFETVGFGYSGLDLDPNQAASGILSAAVERSGGRSVPVRLVLNGSEIATAWVVEPNPDDIVGPQVEYQGRDAGEVYTRLITR